MWQQCSLLCISFCPCGECFPNTFGAYFFFLLAALSFSSPELRYWFCTLLGRRGEERAFCSPCFISSKWLLEGQHHQDKEGLGRRRGSKCLRAGLGGCDGKRSNLDLFWCRWWNVCTTRLGCDAPFFTCNSGYVKMAKLGLKLWRSLLDGLL